MVTLNASEFSGFNFGYDGARQWAEKMGKERMRVEGKVQVVEGGLGQIGLDKQVERVEVVV